MAACKVPSVADIQAMKKLATRAPMKTGNEKGRDGEGLYAPARRFVEEYSKERDITATEAQRRANPHCANPSAQASEWLSQPAVRGAIARRLRKSEQRSADELIQHLVQQYTRLIAAIEPAYKTNGLLMKDGQGQALFTCGLPIIADKARSLIRETAKVQATDAAAEAVRRRGGRPRKNRVPEEGDGVLVETRSLEDIYSR